MKVKEVCSYGFVFLLSLGVHAAWSDDVRPTPAQMLVVDATCLQVVPEQSNLGGATRYTGVLAWVKTTENGVPVWKCAPGLTGEQPTVGFKPVTVWTGDSSDKQFIYFRGEVDQAIKDAVKDNIVTKDEVAKYIESSTKDQLKAAVCDELDDRWDDLVSDVAKEVKKQQDAEKMASPASAQPSAPKP